MNRALLAAVGAALLAIVTGPAECQEAVSWTNVVGASSTDGTLTKTGCIGWNAGAVLTRAIVSGDGFIEFTADETDTYGMAGLSHGDPTQDYTGVVKYLRKGSLFYTSAIAPIYPLLPDTSLYSPGATVAEAVISGALKPGCGRQR